MLAKPSHGRPPGAIAPRGGGCVPPAGNRLGPRVEERPTTVRFRRARVPVRAGWPLLVGVLAAVVAVAAAALLGIRTASDPEPVVLPRPDVSAVRAVAYLAREATSDVLYLAEPRPDGRRVPVAAFPRAFGVRAIGSVAPLGDRIAVLSFTSRGTGRVTVIPLPRGERLTVEGSFDFSAPMAWDAWGDRLALARIVSLGEGGRRTAVIAELDTRTGETRDRTEFADVFLAAPVGYDARGSTLYVVTIDPTGSTLWAVDAAGARRRVALLSAGPTASWRLSPDRTQMAYVALAGAGQDGAARGRVVTLASGAITDIAAPASQLGAVWSPTSLVPSFGGPGGNLWIDGVDPRERFLYPADWSPDGSMLLALVVPAGGGEASLEVITRDGRIPISDTPAEPLGWAIAAE